MKRLIFLFVLALSGAAAAQQTDEHLISMQGAVNFRDLGGYQTRDGLTVKKARLYRSADISKLTDADVDSMKHRHILTVIDFRGTEESAMAPDRLVPGTDYQLCPAGSDDLADKDSLLRKITKGTFLTEFYANTTYLGDRYRPFFQKLLALPEDEAILFHCTGGRDRTGIAAALLLYILEVPMETIEADFVASNQYLKGTMEQRLKLMAEATGKTEQELSDIFELRPAHIRATFAAIEKDYGSLDAFFDQELGVSEKEIALLRNKYTQ